MTYEKLTSRQLSTRIVIGLVDNAAFDGSRMLNPFNFQHYNLSAIALYLDGQQQNTLKPIKLDYERNLYMHTYKMLFSGTVKLNTDEGICISRSDYNNGYVLYALRSMHST